MNRTTWIVIASALLVALTAEPAQPADSGFYLTVGAGSAEEDPGKSIGTNIAIGIPPAGIFHIDPDRVEVDGGDVAWTVGVGYQFSRYLAAEVEYLDFGTTEYSEHYTLNQSLPLPAELTHNYSSRLTGPALSVLGTLPIGERFELFLRAGALFADREIETGFATDAGSMTFGDTVWLGGAGVDCKFAGHWSIRAEYLRSDDFAATFVAGETAVESVSLRLRYKL